jgi:YHS domain-containing protein
VYNPMRLMLGVGALALSLVVCSGAFAQDTQTAATMSPGMSAGSGMMGSTERHVNWSHRYRLTPIEHKRLRAMGLADKEVYAVASAAHYSGQNVDEVAQMVLRGREYFQIARDLNIPYSVLEHRRPEWDTPEWKHAVDEGWYTLEQGTSMTSPPRGTARAAAMACPVCGMTLATTRSDANPTMVKIAGNTYYCCAKCDMSKIKQ